MGYPLEINNYTVFKALSDGHTNPIYNKIISAFSHYKLFVFILHNPKINVEFDQYINDKFSELDNITGDNVLFFSLINRTNPKISEFLKSKHFHFNGLSEETKEFFSNQNNFIIEDKNTSAYFLSKLLKIKSDTLPILILTDNLESDKIYCLKTSSSNLLIQLSYLSNFARLNKNANISLYNFKQTTSEYVQIIDLEKKLSKYLSLFYSTAASITFKSDINKEDSNDYSKNEISKLNSDIIDYKNNFLHLEQEKDDPGFLDKELEIFNDKFYDKNFIYLSGISLKSKLIDKNYYDFLKDLISKTSKLAESPSYERTTLKSPVYCHHSAILLDKDFSLKSSSLDYISQSKKISENITHIHINDSYIEEESKIILDTANVIAGMYLDKEKLNRIGLDKLDFSPLVISLSKFFEIEINLSIVHWIRKKLNIHLPEYFNKYEPDIKAMLQINNINDSFWVNFNKSSGRNWIAPGLGQSEYSFKKLRGKFKWDNVIKKHKLNTKLLLENWENIRATRNKAAHIEIINEKDVIKLQRSIILLNNNDIFKKLNLMKNIFRGIEK